MNDIKPKVITITFFAHATTFDNEAGIATGQFDAELSPLGKQQVIDLKNAVAGRKFDAVFCSDLIRAKETATGAFGHTNQIIIDPRLKEIDVGDMTGEKDSVTHPLAPKYINAPFPHGESWCDVEKRISEFLNGVVAKYPDGARVALVAHQASQLSLDVILKKISWQDALKNDWRKTKSFQFGWDYKFVIDK